MNDVQTTRVTMLCWCLLLFCVIWNGCSSPTFYPARYDGSTTSNACKQAIKLYIDDITATGAIDGGGILLQRPDSSLRRDGSKQWRDTPVELLRQGVSSACLSDTWNKYFTTVASPAQADLNITVHLRSFYVHVDNCEDPIGATVAAVVQFTPTNGIPSTERITRQVMVNSDAAIENLYSATMGKALSNVVDGILISACQEKATKPPPLVSPQVVTIPAWDSLLQRDVGVVVTLGSSNSGTMNICDRFGASIVEWNIQHWEFNDTLATFDVVSPWSISGATMKIQEESSKKKLLLLRFTKIPGIKELEVREMTKAAILVELRKFN